VAAVERGAVSVSVSACMGREEGSVSYPRSSSSSSSSAAADDNKCYTEWDFCSAGSEAENAYFWRLGWCAAAVERGVLSGRLYRQGCFALRGARGRHGTVWNIVSSRFTVPLPLLFMRRRPLKAEPWGKEA